jgi:hypothetical protein
MAAVDMTAYAAALKRMYPQAKIENATFRKNAMYAMLPKDTNLGGENWTRAVHYEDLPSGSATFSVAQANKSASKKVAFLMTSVDDYSLDYIKGKVWRASQGTTTALLQVTKSELDSAFNVQKRRRGIHTYRDGTGVVGRLAASSGISTTSLKLLVRSDVNNFGVGQKLVAQSTTTAAVRADVATIAAVHRRADATTHITTSEDMSAKADAWVNSDYLFFEGDAQGGASNSHKCVDGMQAWLPQTAPTSGDDHFGVDRSLDTTRLAGNVIDGTGMTIEEAIIEGATECTEQGGEPDCVFMPFLLWKQLGLELGSKKEYHDEKVAGINFRGYVLYGPEGDLKVYPDRNCPGGEAYVITKNTWSCDSIGQMPGILDLDDVGKFLRESTDDAYELRCGGYPQLSCKLPGGNAVVHSLPTS